MRTYALYHLSSHRAPASSASTIFLSLGARMEGTLCGKFSLLVGPRTCVLSEIKMEDSESCLDLYMPTGYSVELTIISAVLRLCLLAPESVS